MRAQEICVDRALDRARAWLELHRDNLLPDAILFWRLAVEVNRRRTDAPGKRWPFPRIGLGTCGLRLSSDYLTLARRMSALFSRLPLSGAFPARKGPFQPGHGGLPGETRAFGLASSIVVDVAFINRALAEAASGALSTRTERWCQDHESSTGYSLSHKLLALVLHAAARGDSGLPARDAPVTDKVLAELCGEVGATYVDLTAQRVACLALAGCPTDILRPGIHWLVHHQGRAGDWDYFEVRGNAYETVERVYTGRSPLLRPPLWGDRRDPLLEARMIELAHRGHATAVATCALACFASSSRGPVRSSRRPQQARSAA